MREQKSWASKASLWTATAGVIATLVAASITFLFDRTVQIARVKFETTPTSNIRYTSNRELEMELKAIKTKLASLTTVPKDTAVAAKLAEVESKLDSISSQVAVTWSSFLIHPS